MLEVLPIQTKAEQERLCSLTGSEYIPDALAYAAYGDGEVILNGGVTADKEQAEEGELVTLTASADAGYMPSASECPPRASGGKFQAGRN